MKSKTIVLLAFAGICGLVAMLGVRKALNKEATVETASVLVAMADLPATTRLDETNTEFKAVPIDQVPEDAITDRAQYAERSMVIHALPGDWITMSKLSEPGENGISHQIPHGMRVVTVSVNQTTSHSGMLAPGNRVDVMLTYQARTDEGSLQRTRTVLQYIEVFAVDKLIDGGNANLNEANTRNISVLVTPEQGHLLLLAGKKGDIHLALRSNADTETIEDLAIDASELNGDADIAGFGERSRREALEELYGTGEDGDDDDDDAGDMSKFLQGAEAGTVADNTTEVLAPAEPEPNKWEITIYSGGESTRHEIIDTTVAEEPVAPAAKEAKGKASFWRGLIGTYFRGAQGWLFIVTVTSL